MSIKIVLIILCAAIGTATGYVIMRSYKRNYEYLNELCSAVNELKRNIAYRRDSVAGVLRGMNFKSALLNKNISEYVIFASGKELAPSISRGFLQANVHEIVKEFFTSLGASDGNTQRDSLDMYAERFGSLCNEAENKCKKLGGVAVKLGFLIGLGIGILIL